MHTQLHIGLGGTGIKVLHAIRELLYEEKLHKEDFLAHSECAEFPCAFLALDSKRYNPYGFVPSHSFLNLPSEFCHLDSRNINTKAPNIVPWLFSRDSATAEKQQELFNEFHRKGDSSALQHRRYGRALFAANVDSVRCAISAAMGRTQGNGEERNCCVINIFCSLGGGTGSGAIVDLLSLIREMYPFHDSLGNVYRINLYLFITGKDNTPEDVAYGYFFANQYAALRDLNDLATGLYRPLSLLSDDDAPTDKPLHTPCSFNAFIIDPNETRNNSPVSHKWQTLKEQITHVAQWVLRSAELQDSSDANIVKIITGEDSGFLGGEPLAFAERAYCFAGFGCASWNSPLQELLSMNMHSIKANSFRQMLYNNLSATDGYLSRAVRLAGKAQEKYTRVSRESYMLTASLRQGWNDWFEKVQLQQNKEKKSATPLSDMEKAFKNFFTETVSAENSTEAGELLSLSGRMSALQDALETQLELHHCEAKDLATLLYRAFIRDLFNDWCDGRIGLIHVHDAAIAARDTALQDIVQLRIELEQEAKNEGEIARHLRCLDDRSDSHYSEWGMFRRLTFALKRKSLIQEHKENLIEIYTIRSRSAHFRLVIEQLERYAAMLLDFMKRIQTLIKELERFIDEEDALYKQTNLYRQLYVYQRFSPQEQMLCDYVESADFDSSGVKYIRVNTLKGKHTIVSNAAELRRIVAESILSVAPLGVEDSHIKSPHLRECLDKCAYRLGCAMQREADAACGTKWMDGILTRLKYMSVEAFISNLRVLFDSAKLSFSQDEQTPLPEHVYGEYYRNCTRETWIIRIPAYVELSTTEGSILSLRELKEKICESQLVSPWDLFLEQTDDISQISVCRYRWGIPARMAKAVRFLEACYDSMKQKNRLEDSFWLNIDDLSAATGARLSFPNDEELHHRCKAALWVVQQCPDNFSIDEKTGDVFCEGNSCRDQAIYKVNAHHRTIDITHFIDAVQVHLHKVIRDDHSLLMRLKGCYEATLCAEGDSENSDFRKMVESFIRPTLYRIALWEGIHGVTPE